MPDRVPLPLQTVYADLVDRCQVQVFDDTFPPRGSFVQRHVKGRSYWYYVAATGADGRREQRYVGPDNPELQARIARHGRDKSAYRERRQMVVALQRAGLPTPDQATGDYLAALSASGVFRLRACLVGIVAFQCYAGLLGVRLPLASLRTADLDLAQFHAVSMAIADDEQLPPLLDVLRSVDPTFAAVPYAFDPKRSSVFVNAGGYRVELLVPNRGAERDGPQPLPALGAMGQPLRFLDFLIYDAVSAVLLHEGGVLVNVARPERYAVHKLIVARRRRDGAAKIDKDLAQAAILLEVLLERRRADLRDVLQEALARGPTWRRLIHESIDALEADLARRIVGLAGP